MDQPRNIQLIVVMALAWALVPLSCAEDGADSSADAGLGGQAGTGGGSGAAGAGAVDAAQDSPFAHCENRPPGNDCSFESLCAELECGKAWSMLDEDGCARAECKRDADCSADERCVPSLLVRLGCQGSFVEQCYSSGALCECSITADCGGFLRCVPKAVAPEAADCSYSSSDCNELSYQKGELQSLGSGLLSAEVKQRIDTCITKLEAQMQQHGC